MRVDYSYRQKGIFILLVLMLISLFVSRAGLSISMILLVAVTCLHTKLPAQCMRLLRNPLLAGLTLLFFIPFVSGLWSANLKEWGDVVRIRLPFLIVPLAFAGNWQLTGRQWRLLGFIFLALLVAGSCWSIFEYLRDPATAARDFLQAKTFNTPLGNDHVRFSWLVAMGVLLAAVLFNEATLHIKWILAATIGFFVLYLHLLAARTGLGALYMIMAAALIFFAVRKASPRKIILLVLAFLLLPVACWYLFPTLQNRFHYLRYDLSYIRENRYLPGGNDGNRVLSFKAGWDVLQKNPFGVGAGDVRDSVFHWYDQNIPNMLPSDKLYPSSEWLVFGDTAGWPGILLFTAIMLLPLFLKITRYRFAFIMLQLTAAFSFVFDIGLEVQFGVFLYVFLILWWWKWAGGLNELENARRSLGGDNL